MFIVHVAQKSSRLSEVALPLPRGDVLFNDCGAINISLLRSDRRADLTRHYVSEPGAVAMGSKLKLRLDRVATARRSDTPHRLIVWHVRSKLTTERRAEQT